MVGVERASALFVARIPVLERPGRTRYVRVDDIFWIEAQNQYVRLHVPGRSYLARSPSISIAELERRLDPVRFMRVHRSHIVSLERVEILESEGRARRCAVMSSNDAIPVSPGKWDLLRAALSSMELH